MKYFVYYNLHKHLFSLKNHKTKLVEHKSNTVELTDCIFKVSEASRKRVLKEQRKNVHAGVLGELKRLDLSTEIGDLSGLTELTYNPYLYDSFVVKSSEKPVKSANRVVLHSKRVFAEGIEYKLF